MKYAKGLAAVVAAVLVALGASMTGDNIISQVEWVNVAIAAVTAVGVFAVANVPGAKYSKGIIAFLGAGLVVLQSAIVGGVTYTEWIQIALAALGAIGVVGLKNIDAAGNNLSETGSIGS